ncbi:MAG: acyltransferase [Thermoflexales bacterium]|nr:acyltransferase [Thermoflexales bacterium]
MGAQAKRLWSIELIRAFAAILVLAQHVKYVATTKLDIAYLPGTAGFVVPGVDLFFVLSGAMMVKTVERTFGNPGNIPAFAAGRASRLLPILWLFISLKVIAILLFPNLSYEGRLDPIVVAASYLLLPLPWPSVYPIIGVAWTLSHELLFYTFLVVGIARGSRAFWVGMSVWSVVAIVCNYCLPGLPLGNSHYLLRFILNERNIEFLLGGLVFKTTQAFVSRRRLDSRLAASMLILVGLIWFSVAAAIEQQVGSGNVPLLMFYGLPSALLVLAGFQLDKPPPEAGPIGWAVRIARLVGRSSYSIFATQFLALDAIAPLLQVFKREFRVWVDPTVLVMALFVGAVCVGVLVHVLIEQHLNNAVRQRLLKLVNAGSA